MEVTDKYLKPIQTEYDNNDKLKKSTTLKRFIKYQTMLKKAKKNVLDTVRDITNFELWSSSGIGCSVCNSFYHSRFSLTGGESMYFMDREYCSNFFNNSANYLNFSYYMYLIQHNINVIMRFLRETSLVKDITKVETSQYFMKKSGSEIKKWQNVYYLYNSGVMFGVENSLDKQKSLDSKINNCITDMNQKIFRDDCKDICLTTFVPNKVTIGEAKFVINLFFSEYIIDYYLSSFFTKQFTDISDWASQIMEQDPEKKFKEEEKANIPLKRLKRFSGTVSANNLSEDINIIEFFFKKMSDYEITQIFVSIKTMKQKLGVTNYIDFTKLPSQSTDYKIGWSPFPNTMSYQQTRISYDSNSSQAIISILLSVLLIKLMT